MRVPRKLWQEAEKILRADELTKKMRQITEDYADLVTRHIECAKESKSLEQSKIIPLEIAELRKLYQEFMVRMKPFYVGMSKRERTMHLCINIISTLVAFAALAIAML